MNTDKRAISLATDATGHDMNCRPNANTYGTLRERPYTIHILFFSSIYSTGLAL
ncbi:hypothetical protein H6S82_25610 [Planktothrix sp. FACHB-1355]|uniref:Uncharacterized protein n=1 Tax=Aerosakkonema funiforme FACHB-1375 TaxID=2949571 RepID=A0A926VJK6_9CYAN|nr:MULTISPECIES: hypothetical protein [Oscillatoriales]MBD2183689.1 hypothetical protein [Aerosakkonema funiforme FACHB-1375]MBD3562196.1 hypothetical protein [Planktothrix sp. FACHB-1355]